MKKFINKNLLKIILITCVISMAMSNLLAITTNYSLATEIGGINVETNKDVDVDNLTTASNRILGVIKVVGILLAVGIMMVLGIKYMMGSAEEKAEYKKVFVPYLIGAILLFAASMLAESIYNLANSIS